MIFIPRQYRAIRRCCRYWYRRALPEVSKHFATSPRFPDTAVCRASAGPSAFPDNLLHWTFVHSRKDKAIKKQLKFGGYSHLNFNTCSNRIFSSVCALLIWRITSWCKSSDMITNAVGALVCWFRNSCDSVLKSVNSHKGHAQLLEFQFYTTILVLSMSPTQEPTTLTCLVSCTFYTLTSSLAR